MVMAFEMKSMIRVVFCLFLFANYQRVNLEGLVLSACLPQTDRLRYRLLHSSDIRRPPDLGRVHTLREWSLLPVTISGRFGHFSRVTPPFSFSISIHSGFTIERQRTVLVCPPKTCVHRPVARSQIRTVRSVEPLTKVSLVAASAHTPPSCPSSESSCSPVFGL